jgi:hypothetical protein
MKLKLGLSKKQMLQTWGKPHSSRPRPTTHTTGTIVTGLNFLVKNEKKNVVMIFLMHSHDQELGLGIIPIIILDRFTINIKVLNSAL